MTQQFKYHHEEVTQSQIDFEIKFCGDKAFCYYKERSKMLKGVFHLRTQQMINYHLTEALKDIQDSMTDLRLGEC